MVLFSVFKQFFVFFRLRSTWNNESDVHFRSTWCSVTNLVCKSIVPTVLLAAVVLSAGMSRMSCQVCWSGYSMTQLSVSAPTKWRNFNNGTKTISWKVNFAGVNRPTLGAGFLMGAPNPTFDLEYYNGMLKSSHPLMGFHAANLFQRQASDLTEMDDNVSDADSREEDVDTTDETDSQSQEQDEETSETEEAQSNETLLDDSRTMPEMTTEGTPDDITTATNITLSETDSNKTAANTTHSETDSNETENSSVGSTTLQLFLEVLSHNKPDKSVPNPLLGWPIDIMLSFGPVKRVCQVIGKKQNQSVKCSCLLIHDQESWWSSRWRPPPPFMHLTHLSPRFSLIVSVMEEVLSRHENISQLYKRKTSNKYIQEFSLVRTTCWVFMTEQKKKTIGDVVGKSHTHFQQHISEDFLFHFRACWQNNTRNFHRCLCFQWCIHVRQSGLALTMAQFT